MKIKKYIPIIGILIFIYILFKLDLGRVIDEIFNAKKSFLIIGFGLIFFTCITQTAKWFAIARVQMIKVPFWEAIKINLISAFYGFITPARLGSIIRANYLRKYNLGKIGKGLNNFFLDKILDLVSMVFFIAVFSVAFKEIFGISYFYYSLAIFFLLIFIIIIFRDKNKSKRILRIFYRFLPKKIKIKAKDVFYSSYENIPKKRFFLLFFLLNLFNWVVLFSSSYFIGLAVGIEIPFFYFLAIFPIAILVAQIPITISGLGTREVTLISLFGLLGVEAVKVFSMSLIGLVLGMIPIIIGGILIFKYKLE